MTRTKGSKNLSSHHKAGGSRKNVQEIYNVIVYPSHRNCAIISNPIENYVAVGIGPLSYDSRFVTFSNKPHDEVKGDLRFVAASMQLELPPLIISTKEERVIFNEFRRSHPGNKRLPQSALVELASIFKTKANGTTIFPKLPSQLAAYDSNFQKISAVKITARKMSVPYNELLRSLSSTSRKQCFEFLDEGGGKEDNDDVVDEIVVPTSNAVNFIPPMVAPLQTKYIESIESTLSTQEKKKCVFAPLYCDRMARECGGHNLSKYCRTIIDKGLTLPQDYREKLAEAKIVERNVEKRIRKASKRKSVN